MSDKVLSKAIAQASATDMLDAIQEMCGVDRPTARRFAMICVKNTGDTVDEILQAGADAGPFAMLKKVDEVKSGLHAAMFILQEDETL